MQPTEPDFSISKERLEKIRRYIAERAPLVPVDYKITVDEKVLESLLPAALSATAFSFKGLFTSKKEVTSLPPKELAELKGTLIEQFNRTAGRLPFHASELDKEADVTKRTLVMAPPEKITRYYSQAEKMEIFKEWLCIRHALVTAGAHLETLAPTPKTGGYREVYTRDRYVMIGDTAYLPDPQKLNSLYMPSSEKKSYLGEILQIEKALKARGVKTVTVGDAWFEGGNVVRHYSSRTIFVGLDGIPNTEDSGEKLLNAINKTQPEKWSLLSVPLTNYDMYHMDTGMSEELPHGEVMLSPLVTDKETYQKIRDIVGDKNIIELSNSEARGLATNMIDVGDTLIMTGISKGLEKKLEAKGYTVISPDKYGQPSFEFGGGGVHCMTNDVKQVEKHKHPHPREAKQKQNRFGVHRF